MTTPKTHTLKSWPQYWHAVRSGAKKFDVRRDDRGFTEGDLVELKMFKPLGNDRGAWLDLGEQEVETAAEAATVLARITYVMKGGARGIEEGYAVLALALESV